MVWWEEEFEQSKKQLMNAEQLLKLAYTLLNDYKVMISIANKISDSLNSCVTTFLEHQRIKTKTQIPTNERIKLKFFVNKYAETTGLTRDECDLILELDNLKNLKKEWFIIVNDKLMNTEYQIRKLNEKKLKQYLSKSKTILTKMEEYLKNANQQ